MENPDSTPSPPPPYWQPPPKQEADYPPNQTYPQQQGGTYPQQQGGAYPQQQGGAYPQQQGGAYPQQQGGAYPQQQGGTYPQQQGGTYPQQQGGTYPQQQGGTYQGQPQMVYVAQPQMQSPILYQNTGASPPPQQLTGQGVVNPTVSFAPNVSSQGGPPPKDWKYGLFDCFSVPDICCKACCCPCFIYGETKSKSEGDPTIATTNCLIYLLACCVGFQCCLGTLTRGDIRRKNNIKGGVGEDAFMHFCCECCALIQENREFDDQV
ncbi:hypothetical protein G9A89_002866 [Geosiphon pyriformis]|nr:hypothetical protein G9A89_002866 [Geosiphon pyriformis]